jgi:hypothetical protein
MKDAIVEQIRKYRHEYAERFDFDIDKMYDDLKAREIEMSNRLVTLPPRSLGAGSDKGRSTTDIETHT